MRMLGVSRLATTGQHVLIMDYADQGDLTTYLRKNRDLSWTRKLEILSNLATSLIDFHNAGMIHRDVHGGNILVETRENNSGLTDYGLSIRKDDASNHKKTFGVMPYVAPEILGGEPYTQVFDTTFHTMLRPLRTHK